MIYLDNAATTYKKPQCVIQAVTEALCSGGNSGRGSHEAALGSGRRIYEVREKTADFFGFNEPSNIVFTANTTAGLNMALSFLKQGDHVITTYMEHNSVLRPLYKKEAEGVEISFIPCKKNGAVDCSAAESLIRKETKAIIATHASNVTGNLVDISMLGKLCKNRNLIFIVDAAQTAGNIKISAIEDGIDILCTSAHKGMMAPQGVGILGVRKGIELQPLAVGGTGIRSFDREQPMSMPEHLEAGTMNFPGISGLGAAIDYINSIGIEEIHKKEIALAEEFRKRVEQIDGVRLYGDFRGQRSPVVSLNIGSWDSSEVADALWNEYHIAVRAGAHCAPLAHSFWQTERQGMVRFSFGYFNTEEEACKGAEAVAELAAAFA